MKTLCVIFEAIGPYNGIGRVAMAQVEAALEAGWEVTVIAKRLDESLHSSVEWLKLFVPSRVFALKWLTARRFIQRAVAGRQFDLVLAHQPQVADLADLFQLHYLTKVAYERAGFQPWKSARGIAARLQEEIVLRAEERIYRRWNPDTTMIYCSALLQAEFNRLYGKPPREELLVNPLPSTVELNPAARRQARRAFLGRDHEGTVVGYLGGTQRRKGYFELVDGLKGQNDLFLLLGGGNTDGLVPSGLEGMCKGVGLVNDTAGFYAACDVIIVPSHFDPCPMVVFEAVACGVPVIATDSVGNLAELLEYDAGMLWERTQPLAGVIRSTVQRREALVKGIQRMAVERTKKYYTDLFGHILERSYEARHQGPLARVSL